MGKGKRILAWFLTAALTITSVNLGTPASVKAAEVEFGKDIVISGILDGSGTQSGTDAVMVSTTVSASTSSNSNEDSGDADHAAYIAWTTARGIAESEASDETRIGCLQFDIPSDLDNEAVTVNGATITLTVKSVKDFTNNANAFTKLALYQTANSAETVAETPTTYLAVDDNYSKDAGLWSCELKGAGGQGIASAITSGEVTFDVTSALKNAIEADADKMVLRVMVPRAEVTVYDENSEYAPELVIDADKATTATVKYLAGETVVKDAQEIDVNVGEEYTYAVAEEEKAITKDGKSYVYDAENSALTITPGDREVSGQEINNITVAYKEVSIVEAVDTVSVVTREGIKPVLPATVNAKYSDDSVVATTVEWDEVSAENYAEAGEFTVNGKFAGTDVDVMANVTVKDVEDYLLAKYTFDEDTLTDSTGNKADATKVNTVNTVDGLSGKAISLPGGGQNKGSVKLPDDLLQVNGVTQDDFTVSMFVNRASQGNSFAMILHGTTTNANNPVGHIGLINKDTQFNVEYRNNTSTQTVMQAANPTAIGEWTHIAIVTEGSTGKAWLYENGVLVQSAEGITVKASDLVAQNNYLGKATWPDNDYQASYDEFAVYNVALTADEVKAICDPVLYTSQIAKTKEALEIGLVDTTLEFDANAVTTNLKLPTTGAGAGTTIEWASDNAAVTTTGVVVQPSKGQDDAVVTLTATIKAGSYSDTKEFTVTVPAMEGTNFVGLETAVAEASAKYQTAVKAKIYTADSLKVWKDAIEAAEDVLATKGTEAEVDAAAVTAATETLNAAIADNALVVSDLEDMNEKALAVWYPLTSDATDASGNGVDGNATGVTFDRSTGATFTGGKNFTSCIQIPTDELDSYVESSMTFSFWAYDNSTSGSNNTFGIGTKGGDNGGASKYFYVATGSGNGLNAYVSANGWAGGAHKGFSATAFTNKEWHLITAVLDGTNITLYIDGESKGTVATEITIEGAWDADATVRHAMIGNCAYGYNGDANFTGSIKDFRIYNAALAESQVKEIYDYMGTLPMTYAKDDVLAAVKTTLGTDNVVVAEDGTVTLNITGDTTLPITGTQGETITWASANEAITVDNATGAATVEVPAEGEEKVGTLTATISLNGEKDTVTFATKVFYKNNTDVTALQTAVAKTEAKGYKAADYTTDSWAAYTAALAEAKQYIAQPPKTDEEVTAAVEKLANAEAALVKRADMTALKAAIADVDTKTSTDYTSTSWAAVKTAYDAAKIVAENADTPQADVDAAEAALTNALAALVKLGNKEALIAAITEAKKLSADDYTTETWENFAAVLATVTATKDNKDATEEDVKKAEADLEAAKKALVRLGDKAELNEAIEAAEKLTEEKYTEATWAVFEDALSDAKEVAADSQATEADVNDALTALTEARDALVTVEKQALVDASKDLAATVEEEMADLVESDYTAESWAALQAAKEAAEEMAEKDGKTIEEVAAAKADFEAALAGLKLQAEADKEAAIETAKTELTAAVTTAEANVAGLKEADYTAESWKAVQDALAAAKTVAAKEDATAEELATAKAAVETAISGLTKVPASENGTNNGTNTGTNTGTDNGTNNGTDAGNTTAPTEVKVSSIKITNKNVKIAAGKKVKLVAEVGPEDADDTSVTWKSSNTKYATVNAKGEVKTTKKGAGKTVTITATANDGSGVKATIKVKIMKHAVKSIKLKAPKKITAGKKAKIKATIKTTGKKVNKTLEWTSSNTKFATVKNGTVTTKKSAKGKKVTITAKSTDGTNKKAKVTIRIK